VASKSQGVVNLSAQRKRAAKLLAKAGKDIRQVRSEVSQLKKAGIVSKRIDARSYQPTRYMINKLLQNADVLSGEAVAVKAKPQVRKRYVEKGVFEQRGGALIVPRDDAKQRTRISRGLVEITRPLAMGEEKRLILPFKATDMEAVANRLRDDPSLDGMKNPDELFGFRLFGHTMATIGFPDANELADYILTRYAHLFNGKNGQAAVKNFILFRFKSNTSTLSESEDYTPIYDNRKRRGKKRPDNSWSENRKLARDAARKAKQRERETPEQREKRLDDQRKRSARNRRNKFNDS
jgi:hypothetical protein